MDMKTALSDMPFLGLESQSMSSKTLRTSSGEFAFKKRGFDCEGMKRFGRREEATMMATRRARW